MSTPEEPQDDSSAAPATPPAGPLDPQLVQRMQAMHAALVESLPPDWSQFECWIRIPDATPLTLQLRLTSPDHEGAEGQPGEAFQAAVVELYAYWRERMGPFPTLKATGARQDDGNWKMGLQIVQDE